MGKHHIAYFDLLRGIAIILVIVNHSYTGNPLDGSFKEDLYLVIRQLATFAVPIFLAQSGYFLANKIFNNKKEYFSFFLGHSLRVWVPMVLWSIPLFFIQDHNNVFLSLVFLLLGGYSIYYFITLIIQFYAMQPLLRKVNLGGAILSFILTCVFVAIDNYIVSFKGIHLRLFYECAPFFMWLVYPVMGYYIKKIGRDYNLAPWLIILLISLVACVFESKWLYEMKGEGLGVTKISAVVFSCSAIMVLFSNKVQQAFIEDSALFKGLSYIGRISFGIYLIHKYFIEYLLEPIIGDTLVLACCTLLLSIVFIHTIKVLIPKSITFWLGLR